MHSIQSWCSRDLSWLSPSVAEAPLPHPWSPRERRKADSSSRNAWYSGTPASCGTQSLRPSAEHLVQSVTQCHEGTAVCSLLESHSNFGFSELLLLKLFSSYPSFILLFHLYLHFLLLPEVPPCHHKCPPPHFTVKVVGHPKLLQTIPIMNLNLQASSLIYVKKRVIFKEKSEMCGPRIRIFTSLGVGWRRLQGISRMWSVPWHCLPQPASAACLHTVKATNINSAGCGLSYFCNQVRSVKFATKETNLKRYFALPKALW